MKLFICDHAGKRRTCELIDCEHRKPHQCIGLMEPCFGTSKSKFLEPTIEVKCEPVKEGKE